MRYERLENNSCLFGNVDISGDSAWIGLAVIDRKAEKLQKFGELSLSLDDSMVDKNSSSILTDVVVSLAK